jgi:hypothetical protein
MSNLNNLVIRYPHQFWFLAILRAFIPELSTNTQKGRRRVNASFAAKSPISFWGDLAMYLSQREVLVEHFSDAPGIGDLARSWLKLATTVERFTSIRIKDRPHPFVPAMVIVCYRKPSDILRTPHLFHGTGTPGIWRFGSPEFGPILLIVATELPNVPRYQWLRRSARIPSSGEDFVDSLELLSRTKNLRVEAKKKLMEDMMKIGDNDKNIDKDRAINIIQALREEFAVDDAEREEHRRTREELAATKEKLAATEAELAATKAELAATKAELAATKAELAATKAALDELREEFRKFRDESK